MHHVTTAWGREEIKEMNCSRFRYTAAVLSALCIAFLLAFVKAMPAEAATADQVNRTNIVYDFGNGIGYSITAPVAMSMMMTNADGTPYIDPATKQYVPDVNKIRSFITALDSMFPHTQAVTSNGGVDFMTTRGDLIHVSGGTQRTFHETMNIAYESAYLVNALQVGLQETHVPTYTVGVGGTYIEIDITNQMLYYYENGVKKFETQVVTGNPSLGHDTPTGIFYVNAKMRNQTLVGLKNGSVSYKSFVSYWMPIVGNSVGIHDANWRSKFGGKIYLNNGSHGCINVPPSVMPQLYDMVSTGTTAVVFQ
jgi:lipoprotein-anchoring transpeptidase ErfK/SrfK